MWWANVEMVSQMAMMNAARKELAASRSREERDFAAEHIEICGHRFLFPFPDFLDSSLRCKVRVMIHAYNPSPLAAFKGFAFS